MHSFPAHDPVLIFAIVMLVVLIAPLAAEKLRLPGIIGLITAGIIIGPNLLHLLEKDKTIDLLGTIGLLYIMFEAGLEINLNEVKKNKFHSLFFGFLTFIIPLSIGTLGGVTILKLNLAAAILLASMFSSHTLLTFPIVSKMGLAKKGSISATIGGTIITDTLAFLILAIIIASTHGTLSLIFWLKLIAFTVIYVFATINFLPPFVRWFFRKFSTESGIEEYVFVITILFVLAFLSHLIGLEPVIGAFLAGLTLNTLIPEKSVLMNRINFVGSSLFIPFFLISVGMIINLQHLFKNIETIKVSITMIVIAIVTKYIAAHLFGKIIKIKRNVSNLIFSMSVSQAAATLAAVMVGYRAGIFNESILTGTIMMIVVTCFVGSFTTEKYAKKVALEDEENLKISNNKKIDRILVPLKDEENLNFLSEFSFLIKEKGSSEPIFPLSISLDDKEIELQILQGEMVLSKMVELAKSNQKSAQPIFKIDINISKAILKAIKEYRISKVIFNWNPKDKVHYYIFNRVIDKYLKNSFETTYITRFTHNLGISKSIFLIIPTLLDKQQGFLESFNEMVNLSSEINSKLIIVSDESTNENIDKILKRKKSTIEYNFMNLSTWKNIEKSLKNKLHKNDLIILMLARQGQLAWNLNYDRFPYKLATTFVQNNLIALYPSYSVEEEKNYEKVLIEEVSLLKKIPSEHFIFNYHTDKPQDALYEITQKFFKSNITLYEQSIKSLINSPIELTKEILLVHMHTEYVEDYQVYIISNNNGFIIENISSKPKIIIELFSPKGEPLKNHLNILSEIAKISIKKENVSSILGSNNYEQFIRKI